MFILCKCWKTWTCLKKSNDLTFVTEMWLLHEIKLDILHANFQRITFLCVVQKSLPIIDRQRLTFKASNQLWGLGDLLNCSSFHLLVFALSRPINQIMDFWSITSYSLAYVNSITERRAVLTLAVTVFYTLPGSSHGKCSQWEYDALGCHLIHLNCNSPGLEMPRWVLGTAKTYHRSPPR